MAVFTIPLLSNSEDPCWFYTRVNVLQSNFWNSRRSFWSRQVLTGSPWRNCDSHGQPWVEIWIDCWPQQIFRGVEQERTCWWVFPDCWCPCWELPVESSMIVELKKRAEGRTEIWNFAWSSVKTLNFVLQKTNEIFMNPSIWHRFRNQ